MAIDTLKSLQKRIREATGPDRELDAEIAIALGVISGDVPWKITTDSVGQRLAVNPASCTEVLLRDFGRYLALPRYTTDPDGLGACVALMREVLPGAMWERTYIRRVWVNGHGATPLANDCLTFLDAIIAARIAELEAKEKADAN